MVVVAWGLQIYQVEQLPKDQVHLWLGLLDTTAVLQQWSITTELLGNLLLEITHTQHLI
jgi:hypothetical protein